MGAKAVRQAVTDYIGQTSGIARMYREEPTLITGDAWQDPNTKLPGTVAYTHITRDTEQRYALTGDNPTGLGKAIVYEVAIVVLYQYLIPSNPASKDEWVDGLDELIDNIKARIRADRTLGTGGNPVWQAGEGDPFGGGTDITVQRDMPKMLKGKVLCWTSVEFHAVEMAGTQ